HHRVADQGDGAEGCAKLLHDLRGARELRRAAGSTQVPWVQVAQAGPPGLPPHRQTKTARCGIDRMRAVLRRPRFTKRYSPNSPKVWGVNRSNLSARVRI